MQQFTRCPRFTGVALSVLCLMVAPIAACGGGGTTSTPTPAPTLTPTPTLTSQTIQGCTSTITRAATGAQETSGIDARLAALNLPRNYPSNGGMDSGFAVVVPQNSITVSPAAQTSTGSASRTYGGAAVSDAQLPSSAVNCGTVSVSCPAGAYMLSGGFSTDAVVAGDLRVIASYPSSSSTLAGTWTVTGVNDTHHSHTFTAYAVCATPDLKKYPAPAPLGMTIVKSAAMSINAGSSAPIAATCPSGAVATGGGFLIPVTNKQENSAANVVASQPDTSQDTTWTAKAYAASNGVSETAFVLCTSGYAAVPTISNSFAVDPNTSNSDKQGIIQSSTCQGSTEYKVWGGGFSTADTNDPTADTAMAYHVDIPVVDTTSSPPELAGWQVSVYNNDNDQHSHSAAVYATCV